MQPRRPTMTIATCSHHSGQSGKTVLTVFSMTDSISGALVETLEASRSRQGARWTLSATSCCGRGLTPKVPRNRGALQASLTTDGYSCRPPTRPTTDSIFNGNGVSIYEKRTDIAIPLFLNASSCLYVGLSEAVA